MYIFLVSLEQDQQINFSRPDDFYKRAGAHCGALSKLPVLINYYYYDKL